MAKKNLSGFVYAIIGVFVLVSFVWFVNASVVMNAPLSYNNYSSVGGAVVFNVTFINGTDIGLDVGALLNASVNATFYMGTTVIGYSSVCYDALGDGTNFSCYQAITPTVALDGIGNISAVIINSTGGTKVSLGNLTNVRFDSTGPAITTSSPVSGGNYSNVAGLPITINVSVTDAGVGAISYVFANVTNSTGKQNATLVLSLETGTTRYSSVAMNTTGYSDGLYNITIYANDSLNNLNSSVKISNVVIDNVRPIVYSANISSPVVGTNYSGMILVLNVSTFDVLSGVNYVFFNITNLSGTQKAVVVGNRESSTSSYSNSTFNSSALTDGLYNLSVYVNDSAGNLNSSANITGFFVVDNTAPVLTYSCSGTSFGVGRTMTCSCSASDALSNVSSGPTYTAAPNTEAAGTFNTTCTAADYAGNSITETKSYTVTSSGGGSTSSGSSSSSWTNNYIYNSKEFSLQPALTTNLGSNNKITINVSGVLHYVGVKNISSNSAVIEVASTPVQATLNVGESKKFDVSADGYYDLLVKLNSIANSKANVTISSINEKVEVATVAEDNDSDVGIRAGIEEIANNVKRVSKVSMVWWIIGIIVVVAILVGLYSVKRKGRRK